MAIIGVVGGLGPEGTVHYYRKLAAAFGALPLGGSRPGLVVDHVWMDRFAPLMRAGATEEIEDMVQQSLERLQRAGADVALVAAVTPHKFLAEFIRPYPLPVIDIVEATRDELVERGIGAVGLLGTRLTCTAPFFRGKLETAGLSVTAPDEAGLAALDAMIFGDLAAGRKSAAMRDEVAAIIQRMAAQRPFDALVIACTDLFDLIEVGLPLVNPIDCHVRAVGRHLQETPPS